MEKKELYKKAREYLGKTVSYGIGNIEFDYDRPDGKEYIYEESQDDEDMENFAVMDFLEDLLVDFTKQELDRAREEGIRDALEEVLGEMRELEYLRSIGLRKVVEVEEIYKKVENRIIKQDKSKLTTK